MSERTTAFDRALPGLETALDPVPMSRRLESFIDPGGQPNDFPARVVGVEMIKHKPGRRCALAYTLDTSAGRKRLFAKTYRNDRGVAIFEKTSRLASALEDRDDVVFPRPVAYLPDLRLLVSEFHDGAPVARQLYDGESEGPAPGMAAALAALHGCGVRCGKKWSAEQEMRNSTRWLKHVNDDLRGRMTELFDRLTGWASRVPRPAEHTVHLDFYPEQVMVSAGKVVLLDADDAADGDPAVDLGNFVAHLALRRMQFPDRTSGCENARKLFLDTYARHRPDSIEPQSLGERLRFYEAATLLRLAGVYSMREKWAATLPPRLLDACTGVLNNGKE